MLMRVKGGGGGGGAAARTRDGMHVCEGVVWPLCGGTVFNRKVS